MKTPTLIVRLIGIYLVVRSVVAMIQLQRVRGMMGNLNLGQSGQSYLVSDGWTYSILGLVVGLVAMIFAGWLARVLTFDAGRE